MLQKLRENQKLIAYTFFTVAFIFSIVFLLLEFAFKSDVYINFIWMDILALILTGVGWAIEKNRLFLQSGSTR